MKSKIIFAILFLITITGLLGIYYFLPFNELEFTINQKNYNFTINKSNSLIEMQFYPNMRYLKKEITYKIYNCSLKKSQDMKDAFNILNNLTILSFKPVLSNEEISVTCDEKERFNNGMFIAGEGGPTKIIRSGIYSIILSGKVLLIRESKCERPNIALHELLHALGFKHSKNPENIMYNFTKCKQTLGDDIPTLINRLYSIESYSDLMFENVSAIMHGRYLEINLSVRNAGLADSEPSVIEINSNGKLLKEIKVKSLKIGEGRLIFIKNIWISKTNIQELNLYINSSEKELDKENNNLNLEIKK